MAPLLRRGEPLYANVRRLQRPSGRNGPQSARRHQVQAGLVGHVHRRRVSGEIRKRNDITIDNRQSVFNGRIF